jgi:hypothetical protein
MFLFYMSFFTYSIAYLALREKCFGRSRASRKDGRTTGLEPATFGSTIQRSNQLSYDRHKNIAFHTKKNLKQSSRFSSIGNSNSTRNHIENTLLKSKKNCFSKNPLRIGW